MRRLLATRALVALLIVAGTSARATAQIPNASAAATALSGAYSARARGYESVAWNPANLAMPGNPGFSLALFAVQGSSGLDPISLSDVAPFSGKVLPKSQRELWLQTVMAKGGEHGRVDGGVTFLGVSAGPVALQVSSSVGGSSTLSPDAFQALMFGNTGRTGTLQNLSLQGSDMRVGAFTTAALSYGMSLGGDAKSGRKSALGITAKYVLGNFVAMAQDAGTTATASGVSVDLPVVYSNPDSSKVVGSGMGLDLGYAWSAGKLSFSTTVQNVFNSFKWDETKLLSKSGVATFSGADNSSDFDDKPYASAPAALRSRITADTFKPVVGAGLAYAWTPAVLFSADARVQTGDGIVTGPKTQVGGGLEYRGLPLLRLRGGASYVTGGWGVSGGFGLALGRYELGVGGAMRTVNGGKEPVVALNVLSIR